MLAVLRLVMIVNLGLDVFVLVGVCELVGWLIFRACWTGLVLLVVVLVTLVLCDILLVLLFMVNYRVLWGFTLLTCFVGWVLEVCFWVLY